MMKKSRRLVAIGIIVVFAFVAVAVYHNSHISSDNVVRIGAILPLTGYGAYNGEMARRGLELAATENVEVIVEDSKTNPKDAINAYRRLESLGVKYLISLGGPLSMAIAPLTKGKDVVLFGLATTEADFVSVTERALRMSPSIGAMAATIARYDYENLGKRKAAIVFIEQEYGHSSSSAFKHAFEELGGQVVIEESYKVGEKNFSDIIFKLKNKKPDLIHLIGVGDGLSTFVRQCFEDEYLKTIQISGDMTFASPNIRSNIGEIVKDIYYVDCAVEKDFLQRYNDVYSEEGCSYSAYAYAIPRLIVDARDKLNTHCSVDSIMSFIKSQAHDTVLGSISFSPEGESEFPLKIYRISTDGCGVIE